MHDLTVERTVKSDHAPSPLLLQARANPLALFGTALLLLVSVSAVFSHWVADLEDLSFRRPASSRSEDQRDPARIDLHHRLLAPTTAHWFGTDELGRDIFTRVVFGSRISMMVAVSVVAISLATGLVLGGAAGFYGGWIDTFLNIYVTNAFLALPGILLAVAFVAFLGPGLLNLIFALALSAWVGYARLVRAQVLSIKSREFVEAARALGASDLRVFCRHILPNIVQPLIVQAAIGMAAAVLAEATLSFLGLGTPPPAASWGAMLNDGRSHLFDAPHLIFFPAVAVMLCVLSFNVLGDSLRDFLDPRSRLVAGL